MKLVTPEELLRPDETLGSPDDTVIMQRVFDRFRDSDADTLTLPKLYIIERTLIARGWKNKRLIGPGGFRQTTATGGLTGTDVTSRGAHAALRRELRRRAAGPNQLRLAANKTAA